MLAAPPADPTRTGTAPRARGLALRDGVDAIGRLAGDLETVSPLGIIRQDNQIAAGVTNDDGAHDRTVAVACSTSIAAQSKSANASCASP